MKKTQFIDLITIIKKNIVAFVSVCLFVMLGIGLFLGFAYSEDSTSKLIEGVRTDGDYRDLNILFPYGFSDDDIKKIKELSASYQVEGYYYCYEFLKVDGDKKQIDIREVNSDIDILYNVEGSLPSKVGEIAVEKQAAKNIGLKIGDTITFEEDDNDNLELINQTLNFDSSKDDVDSLMEKKTGQGFLNTYTYKITALVSTPTIMSTVSGLYGASLTNGLSIDGVMFISEDSFKKEAFTGYPGLLIKDNSLNSIDLLSDEYKEAVNSLKSNIEDIISSITDNKNVLISSSVDEVIKTADDKLDDGQKQIVDGEKEIAEKEKQIDDGQIQINNGEKKIIDNTRKLNDGQAQINVAKKSISDAQVQIEENEKLLNNAGEQIEEGKKKIEEAKQEISANEAKIADGENQIKEKEAEIEIAQDMVDLIDNFVDSEFDKSFEECDEVINNLREKYPSDTQDDDKKTDDDTKDDSSDGEERSEQSKEDIVKDLNSIVNVTYKLFNNQVHYYTELYKYKYVYESDYEFVDKIFDEIFKDKTYYEKIANIPFINGEKYIGSYLKDNKVEGFEDWSDEGWYVECYEAIEKILAKEEKDDEDFKTISANINVIRGFNVEENKKEIILNTILKHYCDDSTEDDLTSTIKYLIEEYDAYLGEYKSLLSYVNEGKAQLEESKKQLDDAKKQLEDGKQKLSQAKEELASKEKQLEDGINAYNEGKAKLDSAKEKVADAKEQLALRVSDLNQGWAQLNSAISKLNSAKSELNSAKNKLNEAREKLSDAKKEYSDGKKSVDDFKKARENLAIYKATYQTSIELPSLQPFKAMCSVLSKLKYSMAGLFVTIGLLVCYFSILRMVNDHIKLIGTKKALGFYTKEITRTYLLFTFISTILGCVFGTLLGTYVIQNVIMKAILTSSTYGKMVTSFDNLQTVSICFVEIILLVLITYGAAKFILKENAVVLLAGPKPPSGKTRFYEKFGLYKKISLLDKTIVNNCVTDKRRVLGTLIGVCGCTALVVTALTLNNAISKNYNRQFNDLYHFDSIVYYSDETSKEELNDILSKYNIPKANVLKTYTSLVDNNGGSMCSHLIVPEDEEEFKKLVYMEPTTNKDNDPYSGLWVTYAYKNIYKDSINDEYDIATLSGASARVKASGYFNYYLATAQVFMDKDTYIQASGGKYSTNAILIDTSKTDLVSLKNELSKVDGFVKLEDFKETSKGTFNVLSSLSKAIVGAYVLLSFIMAVLVLLNLYTMFVNEKKKELITLMINGYSLKDAKKYISKDTVLLTIIGIILGLILGTIFGFISIDTFNTYYTYVCKSVDLWACLLGIANSAILSYIMCRIALRKVNKFKLSDINS